jgi:hypothetical protein
MKIRGTIVIVLFAVPFGFSQSFVATPLTDLGARLYLNRFQGGLYENGSNGIPADHAAAGKTLAAQVAASCGKTTSSQCVLLGIGMSNANLEFAAFRGLFEHSTVVNHKMLTVVDGAQGGRVACTWIHAFGDIRGCRGLSQHLNGTRNPYDVVLDNWLTPAGYTESQVKIVWIEEADPGPTVSLPAARADAYTYEGYLGSIVRAVKQRYPRCLLMFIGSRNYGGYATVKLNPEPYAYEYGFSTKWVIQAQINQVRSGTVDPIAGDLNYTNGTAPWIGWAAYTWADGTVPRSDGLVWCQGQPRVPCDGEFDFSEIDGTHPSHAGALKTAKLMMNFFSTSVFSAPWFLPH